jgi:hypothetical protein
LDRMVAERGVSHCKQPGGTRSAFGDGVLQMAGLPNL